MRPPVTRRTRFYEEWIVRHDESLRIIPQELWEKAKDRQREVSRTVPVSNKD
jgi:hypothetical protein